MYDGWHPVNHCAAGDTRRRSSCPAVWDTLSSPSAEFSNTSGFHGVRGGMFRRSDCGLSVAAHFSCGLGHHSFAKRVFLDEKLSFLRPARISRGNVACPSPSANLSRVAKRVFLEEHTLFSAKRVFLEVGIVMFDMGKRRNPAGKPTARGSYSASGFSPPGVLRFELKMLYKLRGSLSRTWCRR